MISTKRPCATCGKELELTSAQRGKLKYNGFQKFYCPEHRPSHGAPIKVGF